MKFILKLVGITTLSIVSFNLFAQPPISTALPVVVVQNQATLLESSDPQLATNKKMVYEFWRLVFNTRDMTLAPRYMREDYIQHNPLVNTGRQPFMDFFGSLPQLEVQDTIPDLAHIMAEGDYVTLAFQRVMPRPGHPGETYTTTWFDMFRIQDGMIAEHWDYGTLPPAQ